MSHLERSLSQHGIEISGWVLPPPGDPQGIDAFDCEEYADLPIEDWDAGLLFLPCELEVPLSQIAKSMGHPVEAYQLALLCIAASLIPSQTRLVVDSLSGIEVPPILWGGLVEDSYPGETHIIDALIQPLRDLQAEHNICYQHQIEDYRAALREYEDKKDDRVWDPPEKPKPVRLYTTDYTEKAAIRILAQQPGRGLLISPIELIFFLESLVSSRDRRRSDHSRWIGLYDGKDLTVGRGIVGKTFVQHPSVSVIGRSDMSLIQHGWQASESYSDDIWGCFAWVRICQTIDSDPHGGPFCDLHGLLEDAYRRLQAFPPVQYALSRAGQKLWREWVEKIDNLIRNEPNERIRIALSRTKERAARVALVLHCLDAACLVSQPDMIVPASTLARAIGFVYQLQEHARGIHKKMWELDYVDPSIISRFIEKFKGCGPVDLKRCRSWWPGRRKPPMNMIRDFFCDMVRIGHARWIDLWLIEII